MFEWAAGRMSIFHGFMLELCVGAKKMNLKFQHILRLSFTLNHLQTIQVILIRYATKN